MMRRLVTAAILTGLLLPGIGRAAQKVSVFDLEASQGAEAVAKQVTKSLRRQVANQSGLRIVAGKSLAEIKLVFGCPDRPLRKFHRCLARVGRSLKADQVIVGRVRRQGGAYKVVLTLLDVDRPLRPKTVSEQLPAAKASGSALESQVANWFGRLFPSSAPGFITVLCNVDGIAVSVDGKPRGECSMVERKLRAKAGTHTLRFSKAGFETTERVVTVRGGETSSLNVTLPKVGGAPPDDRRQPGVGPGTPPTTPPKDDTKSDPRLKWKVLFYSTAGAGAALLVASIFTGLKVKSLEDDKIDAIKDSWDGPNPVTTDGNACKNNAGNEELVDICNQGSDMATATNALIGVGAALIAGSGYFLYRAYFGEDEERATRDAAVTPTRPAGPTWVVTPTFSEQGGGVSATFRF
jgi:TolB-like protein